MDRLLEGWTIDLSGLGGRPLPCEEFRRAVLGATEMVWGWGTTGFCGMFFFDADRDAKAIRFRLDGKRYEEWSKGMK